MTVRFAMKPSLFIAVRRKELMLRIPVVMMAAKEKAREKVREKEKLSPIAQKRTMGSLAMSPSTQIATTVI
tara:strand:- start:211 stop:423 length:213 start_codon:yes stop_codon:yes gene_type:complete